MREIPVNITQLILCVSCVSRRLAVTTVAEARFCVYVGEGWFFGTTISIGDACGELSRIKTVNTRG